MSIAVILGVLAAVWVIRALFWPYTKCSWCKGTGRNWGSTSKRFGYCWFCKRTGRRQVLGSRALHRALRSRKRWGK